MKHTAYRPAVHTRFGRFFLFSALLTLSSLSSLPGWGQTPSLSLSTVPAFSIAGDLVIRQPVMPAKPFTVTGARGAILGMQTGEVELWQLPVKVFTGLHLSAELDGYPVPIDLQADAAEIEVHPGHTILTYSHPAITVRQHMLVAPARRPGDASTAGQDSGALIYFEIASIRPATLTISMRPAMAAEWPAPQYGVPSADWVAMGTGGAYSISTDNPAIFGMIAMPNATPGYLPPYQERPQTRPLQFRVRYEPARDASRLFPLLSVVAQPGERNSPAAFAALRTRLIAQAGSLAETSREIDAYYAEFLRTHLAVHTPDASFDRAMRWAEIAIEEAQVETRTGSGTNARSETGLVAGWFPSFDSARPGFGWYFGRDTLWSLYAIDSDGDQTLARRALEFLIRRQRADGKMMHEYSLSADFLTGEMAWSNFGYEYAAADSTPLYLLAMEDYVKHTADLAFLRDHFESVKRAYRFERTTDSDGDGVYDNSQGTGWVEDWRDPHPHQELYLAALDGAATQAMGRMAHLLGEEELATSAANEALKIDAAVERYRGANGLYAFNRNLDGTFERTLTIYPAVALWSNGHGLAQPEPMLSAWSGAAMATDWGTRSVATTESNYDPIAYHQGSVWPLFTGWNAMAQYRSGRPLAGYTALQQNVRLTFGEDPGAVTEVLSGQFFQPLGRSSTHQLWSSAMTLAPAVRGLFGIGVDALQRSITVHPQLPVLWNEAELENVRVGEVFYHITFHRAGDKMDISAVSAKPSVLCLNEAAAEGDCKSSPSAEHHIRIALPAVEVGLHAAAQPLPGDETALPHVTGEHYDAHRTMLTLQARAGTTVLLDVRRNGQLEREPVAIHMPAGSGFVQMAVTLDAVSAGGRQR